MNIQNAVPNDAKKLALLINLAGEGIPYYLWSSMAEGGEQPIDVGTIRAQREEGCFSYRNARVIKEDLRILGMHVSYTLPSPYKIDSLEDLPPVIRPLIQLEAKAAGYWYINAVATFEHFRGIGLGKKLLEDSEQLAIKVGATVSSLIVSSTNKPAINLYQKLGYSEKARLAMFPLDSHFNGDWLLMFKSLNTNG